MGMRGLGLSSTRRRVGEEGVFLAGAGGWLRGGLQGERIQRQSQNLSDLG